MVTPMTLVQVCERARHYAAIWDSLPPMFQGLVLLGVSLLATLILIPLRYLWGIDRGH